MALILLALIGMNLTIAGDGRARARPPMPKITRPVLFGTPEADRILTAVQVFPPDNPWNQEIAGLPVHANSPRIIASIGSGKHLGYNLDMNFVIVPPDQPRVAVKILLYPAEPIPDRSRCQTTPPSKTGRSRGMRIRAPWHVRARRWTTSNGTVPETGIY
jgi:hypothetical protein